MTFKELKQYRSVKREVRELNIRLNKAKTETETAEINRLISKCNNILDSVYLYITSQENSVVRRVMTMRYIEGYKPQEIACKLGNGYTAQYVRNLCTKTIRGQKKPP